MTITKIKGYKVTDCKREKRYGVACSSLEELIEKGCKKLNIDNKQVTVHLQDGTVVDCESYFKTLPSQTFFVFRQPDEFLSTGADLIYNALKLVNIEVLRTGDLVKQFFDEKIKEKLSVLCSHVIEKRLQNKSISTDSEEVTIDKTRCSSREDDPDWFNGLETNAKTKESFMFKRSQDRIRAYFYKTRLEIKKLPTVLNNDKVVNVLENVFNSFKSDLMKDEYFGCYLDRSNKNAMCDKNGLFTCGGLWKEAHCFYGGKKVHVINPYSSKEERILFSTWNLDHCIERSRSIIPALLEASIQASTRNGLFIIISGTRF